MQKTRSKKRAARGGKGGLNEFRGGRKKVSFKTEPHGGNGWGNKSISKRV